LTKLRNKCPELFAVDTVIKKTIIPEYKYSNIQYFPHGYKLQTPQIFPYTPLVLPVISSRISGNIILNTNSAETNLTIPADTVKIEIPVEKIMPCNRKHLPDDYPDRQQKLKRNYFLGGVFTVVAIYFIRLIILKRYKK
jgi:hypothetical protein